jgi:hypothetical protein
VIDPGTWPRWLQLVFTVPHVILAAATGIIGWCGMPKKYERYLGLYICVAVYLVLAFYFVIRNFTL